MANVMLKQKALLAGLLGLVSASFSVFAQPGLAAVSIDPEVVRIAEGERGFWGGRKESAEWRRVVIYWREGVGVTWIDTQQEVIKVPWSAAFVSYVMRKAGAGNQFVYSANHRDYILDAIKKRKDGKTTAPFVGYRLSEAAPLPGDLVCASRAGDAGRVTFDNALTYGRFSSHCDIVVAKRTTAIDVIGGNVSDSVTRATITLVNGRVPSTNNRFVLIRNNATKQ
ncbi:MAG: DUF2272 domain-containing protein [Phormidesmis sp. CAN_BIN44]|nr:DUF2272 domain-containing protein [Phormidesmis sp. CAN_BIN44]